MGDAATLILAIAGLITAVAGAFTAVYSAVRASKNEREESAKQGVIEVLKATLDEDDRDQIRKLLEQLDEGSS